MEGESGGKKKMTGSAVMEISFWPKQTISSYPAGEGEGGEGGYGRARRGGASREVGKEVMVKPRPQGRPRKQRQGQRAAWTLEPWGRKKFDDGTFLSFTGTILPNYHQSLLRHKAAQGTLTIKLDREFHFCLFSWGWVGGVVGQEGEWW